jgi:endo-1,3(4)-beta-glucanase
MIPVSPINGLVRTATFIQEEWDDILSKEAIVTGDDTTNAWLSLLLVNQAVINQADALAKLATATMDDGLTRSWALYNAASRGGSGSTGSSTTKVVTVAPTTPKVTNATPTTTSNAPTVTTASPTIATTAPTTTTAAPTATPATPIPDSAVPMSKTSTPEVATVSPTSPPEVTSDAPATPAPSSVPTSGAPTTPSAAPDSTTGTNYPGWVSIPPGWTSIPPGWTSIPPGWTAYTPGVVEPADSSTASAPTAAVIDSTQSVTQS